MASRARPKWAIIRVVVRQGPGLLKRPNGIPTAMVSRNGAIPGSHGTGGDRPKCASEMPMSPSVPDGGAGTIGGWDPRRRS